MDRDPVCRTVIRPAQELASITYRDQVFRFCSPECKKEFEKNPKTYANQVEVQAQS